LSETGLMHARGNSGIIFASYVSGIAEAGAGYDAVNAEEFAQIAHRAVEHLYRAVEKPVEGTMISVIREWASALSRAAARHHSFRDLMAEGYAAAGVALQRTTEQLEVLRRNHVVDAGAEGFVRFLEGINRFISGEVAPAESEPTPDFQIEYTEDDTSSHRYCTEVLVDAPDAAIVADSSAVEEALKRLLHPYGNSLIVSTQGRKTRVHIHTDTPALVVDSLKPYGVVLEQKVDDMRLQASVREHRKHPVGLLTDSIADLPEDYKLENQIHTLPLGLILDGTIYLDKVTIQPNQLTEAIARSEAYPTSSLPEPGRVRAFLESLVDLYDSLIFITVSSEMSGTHNVINRELRNIDLLGKKVTVIDSLVNSGAEGLLVKTAADMLNAGATDDEVVARIQQLVPRTRIYVCLETLEYAVRSGRVPNTVGRIGIKLGLRPIMSVDASGKGTAFGAAFSRSGITKKIHRLVRKRMESGGIQSYAIVHVDNPELAEQYSRELTAMIGREPDFVTEVSSVIAIHSGPGSVAVCLIENQEVAHA
ncbi:MAG: DegV family protein, partial [Anaerolineae bacterium]